MSRGLGTVERYILNEISTKGYCIAKDVPALQPSVSRSVKKLCEKNLAIAGVYDVNVPDKGRRFWQKDTGFRNHAIIILFAPETTEDEQYKIRLEHDLATKEHIQYMKLTPEERAENEREIRRLGAMLGTR